MQSHFGQLRGFSSNRKIGSIARKFFCANVVLIHSYLLQHLMQSLHHHGRPGNVVDGRVCVFRIPGKHLLIDQAGFTVPRLMRFLHFRHAGNELVLRIVFFQALKLCQERRIFWASVGVEKDNAVRRLWVRVVGGV
jgi:hypothetical protein